jgi:hypothetical protein
MRESFSKEQGRSIHTQQVLMMVLCFHAKHTTAVDAFPLGSSHQRATLSILQAPFSSTPPTWCPHGALPGFIRCQCRCHGLR